jgi:hypothetical protein
MLLCINKDIIGESLHGLGTTGIKQQRQQSGRGRR